MNEEERNRLWWQTFRIYIIKSKEFREHAKFFENMSLLEAMETEEWKKHDEMADEICRLVGRMREISRMEVEK